MREAATSGHGSTAARRRALASQNSCLRSIDRVVGTALAGLGTATELRFEPASDERPYFREIRSDYGSLTSLVTQIKNSPRPSLRLHQRAENVADKLKIAAQHLATQTQTKTDALVAQNRSSYESSRNLFIGVAAGAVVLALLLGFVLSWALIGPIQRIGGASRGIASGDFSRHVEVANRDELGALAANVNRMNDELQRLYRELEAASRHKSEFLANMSHELRTPLNAIIGFTQVLQQKLFGEVNDKQEEYLEDIHGSANHLLALINDVLDLSKVEAGQVELEVAPFSLREALERGVVMVRERAVKNGVRSASSPTRGRAGRGRRAPHPPGRVQPALERGQVHAAGRKRAVSSAQQNGEVLVSVADTGPGIALEDQERIFEEFQQTEVGAGAARGHRPRARTLGKLVELHGGRIWVESELGRARPSPSPCPRRRRREGAPLAWLNSLTAKYVAVFTLLVAVPADRDQLVLARLLLQRQQAGADQAAAGPGEGARGAHRPDLGGHRGSPRARCRGRASIERSSNRYFSALVKSTFLPLTAFYVDRRGSTVAAVGPYEELAGLKDRRAREGCAGHVYLVRRTK